MLCRLTGKSPSLARFDAEGDYCPSSTAIEERVSNDGRVVLSLFI